MKIKIKNYDITAKAKIDPDSDIWKVTDVISGLLQTIGFGEDTVAMAIRDEDEVQDLWLVPTEENLEKWAEEKCLVEFSDDDGPNGFTTRYVSSGQLDIIRFIPIATLCG